MGRRRREQPGARHVPASFLSQMTDHVPGDLSETAGISAQDGGSRAKVIKHTFACLSCGKSKHCVAGVGEHRKIKESIIASDDGSITTSSRSKQASRRLESPRDTSDLRVPFRYLTCGWVHDREPLIHTSDLHVPLPTRGRGQRWRTGDSRRLWMYHNVIWRSNHGAFMSFCFRISQNGQNERCVLRR